MNICTEQALVAVRHENCIQGLFDWDLSRDTGYSAFLSPSKQMQRSYLDCATIVSFQILYN